MNYTVGAKIHNFFEYVRNIFDVDEDKVAYGDYISVAYFA